MAGVTWDDSGWANDGEKTDRWRRIVWIDEKAYGVWLPPKLQLDFGKANQIESDIEQIIASLNDRDACEENRATGEKVWKKEVEKDVITIRRQPWKDRTSVTSAPDA